MFSATAYGEGICRGKQDLDYWIDLIDQQKTGWKTTSSEHYNPN